MNDTKQPVSEKSPEYLAATLREVAETLTDVGKTIDARLGAWEETAEPEPKPPSVEVMSAATGALRRYKSITSFVRRGAMWEVYGGTTVGGGTVHTMTTPFAIWQECIAAGVPCCDPPYADLTLNIGDRWRVFSIMELRVSPHTGNSFIRCIGNRPDYGARYAVENTYYVTESPDAIRAACDAAGVPCPEGEKPRGIDIVYGAGAMRFDRLTAITARLTLDNKPGLFVTGTVGATDGATFTTTPIADIRKQAAEAGIDLPEVTVQLGTAVTLTFSAITRIYIDASLRQHIAGKRADYDKPDTGYGTCGATIPQVLALCAVAGWPKPQVRCVFTFANGDPCEVDPASVCSVDTIRLPGERSTLVTCEDGSTSCFVREPVPVVQRMIDACREGE